MKITCNIIEDLLPLYVDDMVSEDSRKLVEEHLKECPACRKMQEEMMTVLIVEPMKAPYVKSIPNELEDLQQAVGGDIEMTYPFDDKVGILLNGNGKFEGLPLNRALYDDHGHVYDAIAGTFLVVGLTEDDFTSLTPEQIEKFKEKYQSPEIFTLFNGELHVMKMPPEEEKEQKESRKNDAKQKNPAKKKNRSGDAR